MQNLEQILQFQRHFPLICNSIDKSRRVWCSTDVNSPQPHNMFCYMKRLVANKHFICNTLRVSSLSSPSERQLMKGIHFLICSGMFSFQPRKLLEPLFSFSLCFCFMPSVLPPFVCLSIHLLFAQQSCVTWPKRFQTKHNTINHNIHIVEQASFSPDICCSTMSFIAL